MMDLKTTKYRVTLDESYDHETEPGKSKEQWRWREIRGRYGMIYPYNERDLGVQVKARIVAERTRREQKWLVLQDADDPVVFKTPNENLDIAAKIIKARTRRIPSPEQKAKMLVRIAAYRFKKTPKNGTLGA